jgi:hypothetical protein
MTTTELTITDLLLRLDEAARVETNLKTTIDERLAATEVEIAWEVDQLAANRAAKESIRAEIHEAMIANGGGVYNDTATGHTASLRTTTRTVIADPDKVKQSLAAIGELDACLKLDDRAVFDIAKRRPVEGLETIASIGLVIK